MKKAFFLLLTLLLLVTCGTLVSCGNTQDTTEAPDSNEETTPAETEAPKPTFVFDGEYAPLLPKAPVPEKIYTISKPGDDDALTLLSAQGLFAKNSNERIFIQYDTSTTAYLNAIKKHYPQVTVSKASGMWLFLKSHTEKFSGYILTDMGDDSVNVATSLAGILNALIVTPKNESTAKTLGLEMLLDVSDKDDAWLRSSEYFDKLNKDIAFMLNPTKIEFLRDYAIYNNAYMFTDTDVSQANLIRRINFLNDGFVVMGWNNNLGEHGTVEALSSQNGNMIPSDYAKNIVTLSSFPLVSAEQITDVEATDGKGKHTVCLVMSDGDNMQWVLNDFLSSTKWYASPHRGDFPLAWGLPAALMDLAPPSVINFYNTMTPNDAFMLQLSGTGYTFPSRWKNMDKLAEMQKDVGSVMDRADLSVLEILDDVSLNNETVEKYYGGFLKEEAIDGVFYIDYGNYAGYNGKIFWVEGKPLITARYRLWADVGEAATIEGIAKALNKGSTNPANPLAYSFVIIHAWSGLDGNGNFVNGGNTMNAVAKLVELLDDDVELVTPEEFVSRVTENVKH